MYLHAPKLKPRKPIFEIKSSSNPLPAVIVSSWAPMKEPRISGCLLKSNAHQQRILKHILL